MRILKFAAVLLLFLSFEASFAQKGILKGKVIDEKTGQGIIGANVVIKNTVNGTITDMDGNYSLSADEGTHPVVFKYVGYAEQEKSVAFKSGQTITLDIKLSETAQELGLVVVSGTKYEKDVSEQVVSMEVMKLSTIQNSNSKVTESLNKVPGVNMLGGNISIRGGSGFSDGANTRVMLLLDDLPLVGAENGAIHWEALPLESVEQMEVIKGASSALYGTSALNGVINIRTGNPKDDKPYTKIVANIGGYQKPMVKNYVKWWETDHHSPVFGGVSLVHRRKIKGCDISFGGNYSQDESYLQYNNQKRFRFSTKFRKVFEGKLEGLTVGLNTNFSHESGYQFFTWKGYDLRFGANPDPSKPAIVTAYDDSSIFKPKEIERFIDRILIIDPYMTFYNKQGDRHALKFRFNHNKHDNFAALYSVTNQYYGEYSYVKLFDKIDVNITTGVSGYIATIKSITFNGQHQTGNAGVYLQADKKFIKRITLSAGVRAEFSKIDNLIARKNISFSDKKPIMSPVVPVFRVGLNVQAARGTFIRASFGQGFRFPTAGELFIFTTRAGGRVYPNQKLVPESGWSTELGIKQAVKLKEWFAYFDVAAFYSQYKDMIDYKLGMFYDPNDSSLGFGAQAQNIQRATIFGTELSAYGQGKLFGIPLNFIVGYSYVLPYETDSLKNGIKSMGFNKALSRNGAPILYFRNRHNFKADVEATWKGASLGLSFVYTSFVEQMDGQSYGFAPGLFQYRQFHTKGYFVMDMRAGYSFLKDHAKVSFICKNLLNSEYMLRAGYIEPPRNFAMQLSYQF